MPIRLYRVMALCAALVLLAGCSSWPAGHDTIAEFPKESTGQKIIYVLSHGWHTGIVVRRADIPSTLWPEKADFSDQTYLEVGWGDETFYRARKTTLGMALKAAFMPTRAVLHVVGFSMPVDQFFSQSGVVELRVPDQGFLNLVHYIHDTVQRDEGRPAAAIGPGLYGISRFYRANGTYSLFHNSNHWVAYALQKTGAPVTPQYAATASEVFSQASHVGLVIRRVPGE